MNLGPRIFFLFVFCIFYGPPGTVEQGPTPMTSFFLTRLLKDPASHTVTFWFPAGQDSSIGLLRRHNSAIRKLLYQPLSQGIPTLTNAASLRPLIPGCLLGPAVGGEHIWCLCRHRRVLLQLPLIMSDHSKWLPSLGLSFSILPGDSSGAHGPHHPSHFGPGPCCPSCLGQGCTQHYTCSDTFPWGQRS